MLKYYYLNIFKTINDGETGKNQCTVENSEKICSYRDFIRQQRRIDWACVEPRQPYF
jgi:hypothetical protein